MEDKKDIKRPESAVDAPAGSPSSNKRGKRDKQYKLDPQPQQGGHGPMRGRMFVEKPKDAKGTIKKILRYIGKSKYLLIMLILLVLSVTAISLVGPTLQANAIDAITISDSKLKIDWDSLRNTLLLMGGVALLNALFTYLQSITAASLSQYTVRTLRNDLFKKISYLPIRYIDTHRHGDIMSRMTNDVENISNTISNSIASLVSGSLTIIGTLVLMLYYSPLLTLVSMVSVVLTLISTKFLTKYMKKYFVMQQKLLGNLNGHVEEMVTGYKTVVAFSREKQAQDEFNSISNDLKKCGIRAQIFSGLMGPLMNIIGNIGFLLIAAVGGSLVLGGSITIGVIQAFITYSRQFTRPINELANLYGSIQTAIAGAERVFEIIENPSEIDEGTTPLVTEDIKGNIDFEGIDFSYVEGEPVLKKLSMSVKAGQKIAIVGATGSGKTTIVNLLTRFYDVDSGSIKLDGIDVRDIPKRDLRHNIAIVLQDTVIFSDTVAANIRYGKLDATDEEIVQAAKTANVDEFATKLTGGYDTMLTESGGNLSQGQRQLISIARAVLADPRILILDEATSSIDTRTEMHIQEAMISLMKGRTSLIIAHRLSTIRDADLIVVVDDGKIVESGDHDSLLAQGGCYYRLYQSQFAGIAT